MQEHGKVRYAVVGLGYIAQSAVLPAFKHASENSELVAFVTEDPEKVKRLRKKYNVKHSYSYQDFDACLNSGEIDAVYIALPNHMHREFVVRAAKAGVHVLCEKPMAVTEDECKEMIVAADINAVQLMIAYRLHFEEANLKAMQICKDGELGDLRIFNSVFTMQVEEGNIRLHPHHLGGGTLYDIGIYCINAARSIFRSEPTEVFAFAARNGERRFAESEEMITASLRFPGDRMANFVCSFGSADRSRYEIIGTEASLALDPAFDFSSDLTHYLTRNGKTTKTKFKKRDQFAPELIHFSSAILERMEPGPTGMEGLADVRVISALYQSIESRRPVLLPHKEKEYVPVLSQEMKKPAVDEPELVHAEPPSGKSEQL